MMCALAAAAISTSTAAATATPTAATTSSIAGTPAVVIPAVVAPVPIAVGVSAASAGVHLATVDALHFNPHRFFHSTLSTATVFIIAQDVDTLGAVLSSFVVNEHECPESFFELSEGAAFVAEDVADGLCGDVEEGAVVALLEAVKVHVHPASPLALLDGDVDAQPHQFTRFGLATNCNDLIIADF